MVVTIHVLNKDRNIKSTRHLNLQLDKDSNINLG
jgi:hypothetical protein